MPSDYNLIVTPKKKIDDLIENMECCRKRN